MADIPAENFFTTTSQDVEIIVNGNDTLVFDEGQNSRYVLDGRNLSLIARNIRVVGNVVVRSFADAIESDIGQGRDGRDATDRV